MKNVYFLILMAALILAYICPSRANIVDIGRWSFDDESNPGKDDSGHGQNGTLKNGAQRVWVEQFAGALKLDGVDDYVIIPDHPSQSGMSQLRLEAWVNPSDSAVPPPGQSYAVEVITKWGLGGVEDDSYGMYLTRTGESDTLLVPSFWICGGSQQTTIPLIANTPIPFNQWTHLTAVYDGLRSYLYIDKFEVAVSNISIPGLVVQDTDIPILIGKGFYQPFAGMIDEVRIATPEPATFLLLGLGGLVLRMRRGV